MNIGIAGAGLLGRLLAFELARLGHTVTVYDAAAHPMQPNAAGWTAAGMLSPMAELESANLAVFEQGLRSLEQWPCILKNMQQHTQTSVMFQKMGSLLLAHRGDSGAAQRVLQLLASKTPEHYAHHAPQTLSTAHLQNIEPQIHAVAHAWLLPHEGQIDTVQAMTAMYEAATALGVQWHWHQTVTSVNARHISTQQSIHSSHDWVFDVRGAGAKSNLPVRGVRGEIFWLHAPEVQLQRPIRLLHPRHRVYIVPRDGARILVGASEIESEDRSPVSLRTTVELLAAAHSVIPALAESRLIHSETNLRPALSDNLPHLEQRDGITRINGLFRHGWLIAPALVEQALKALP